MATSSATTQILPGVAFACLAVASLSMTPSLAAAASDTDEEVLASAAPAASQAQSPPGSRDFLFGRPKVIIGVRAQWLLARADSEIFRFFGERLSPISESMKPASDRRSIGGEDFTAPGIAVDVGIPLTSRLDVVGGFEFSRVSIPSSFRNFSEVVDGVELEIEQTTSLSQVALSGSLELALTPRGRAIGQFAWIPARVTPYVGAGFGALLYRLEQIGDFVDEADNSIFSARLEHHKWTPETHAYGGVDVRLHHHVQLTVEARYLWAAASMSRDFVDFDDIDLAGLRLTTGIQLSF
jgi:hypothetical protein